MLALAKIDVKADPMLSLEFEMLAQAYKHQGRGNQLGVKMAFAK